MSQVVLADEINRATPKTQSALLESMDEHQVTVDGTTYQLPEPFLVMATQNPIEYEGTFPLSRGAARPVLHAHSAGLPDGARGDRHPRRAADHPPPRDHRSGADVRGPPASAIGLARDPSRRVREEVRRRTSLPPRRGRTPTCISALHPRGSLALSRAAQAFASMNGRDYVVPDDVKGLAAPTHRPPAHSSAAGASERSRGDDRHRRDPGVGPGRIDLASSAPGLGP